MDHLEVLREKIARLRSEIADIQGLNEQYRFRGQKGAEADIAHSQRQERLQAIQEELVQLSQLGHKTLSIEQMREKHRSRLHLAKMLHKPHIPSRSGHGNDFARQRTMSEMGMFQQPFGLTEEQ